MLLSGSGAEETNDVPKAPGAERGLIADHALSLSRCTSEAGGRRGAWSNEKGEAFGAFGDIRPLELLWEQSTLRLPRMLGF